MRVPLLLLCACLGIFLIDSARLAQAQTPAGTSQQPANPPPSPNLFPSLEPVDLTLLEPGTSVPKSVVTATTISQKNLTVPSLWWAKEQFGGKLLDNWLAYPGNGSTPHRVDLIVNRQLWSLLDYLERYEFVNHLGTVARDYGYNTRVFNRQGLLLAAYTCDFSLAVPSSTRIAQGQGEFQDANNVLACSILLNSSDKSSLRGRSTQPGESPSIRNGTEQP
jgi:hypothetical protein